MSLKKAKQRKNMYKRLVKKLQTMGQDAGRAVS